MRLALTCAGLAPPPLRCLRFAARFLADGVRAARSVSALVRKSQLRLFASLATLLWLANAPLLPLLRSCSLHLVNISPRILCGQCPVPAPLPGRRLRTRACLAALSSPLLRLRCVKACGLAMARGGHAPGVARGLKARRLRAISPMARSPWAAAIIAPLPFGFLQGLRTFRFILWRRAVPRSARLWPPLLKVAQPLQKNNRQHPCRLNKTSFILYNCIKFFSCCQVPVLRLV